MIVLQPGSRFLKVGRATDAFPVMIPHVLARPASEPYIQVAESAMPSLDPDQVSEQLQIRSKQAKKKAPSNVYQSVN